MSFGAAYLRGVLEEHLPEAATGLAVAVSGGADSACLLTALQQVGVESVRGLAVSVRGLPVRALHVDHGLQPLSTAFREASAALCRRLQVPLTVIAAAVPSQGVSIEAAAREARYLALSRQMRPGECLLTAHHAEDQAETLLLQLLRGAGLKGLCAMPVRRPLGAGWHLRPLLEVARRELRAFGKEHRITAIEDPMNSDPKYDRSFLRAQLWPQIEGRWRGAAAALSRSARHLAEAQELLDQRAAVHLRRLRDGEALSLTGLRSLAELDRINTLRYWLSSTGVAPPPTARLTEALRQVLAAGADRSPAIVWGPYALRRYRARLFVTSAERLAMGAPRDWLLAPGARLELGPGLGRLRWAPRSGGLDASRLPERLSVRPRRGGEALRIGRGARTRSVQHLCQSRGVLPWMRDALPLLYAGEELIAVADLWQDARWCVPEGAPGFAVRWEEAPYLG